MADDARSAAPPPERGARRWIPWVLLATAWGAWLRARGLDDFWITHWDEGLAWRGALAFASLGAEGHYSPSHAPPLVPALLAVALRLFGSSPGAAVAVNVVLATLAIPLAFLVGRAIVSARAGVIAAFALATSGLHVMYARSLLTESAYVLGLLVVLLASARAARRPSAGRILAASAAVVALQYTKYNGCIAALPLLGVWTLDLVRTPGPGALRRFVGRAALLGLPVLLAMALDLVAIAVVADLDAFLEHFAQYLGDDRATLARLVGTLTWVAPSTLVLAAAAGLVALVRSGGRLAWLLHGALLVYTVFLFRYTPYLRLFAPVLTLLLLYAAAALDRLLAVRPRWAGVVAALSVAGLVSREALAQFPRHYLERFDGYRRAVEWLEARPTPLARLFVSQDFVWVGLEPPATVAALPSTRAEPLLEAAEVELVLDVGAFSRLRPWDLTRLLAAIEERHAVDRLPNTLNLDALENNLTLDELRRLAIDPALRERVLSIHVVRLPGAELRDLVQRVGTQRTR